MNTLMKETNKFICNKNIGEIDVNLLYNKADVPQHGIIYTLIKCFYHIGYRIKDCKYAMHFKELNHGNLIGYDAKYFYPVDEQGNLLDSKSVNIKIEKEENPKWKIVDGIIIHIENTKL